MKRLLSVDGDGFTLEILAGTYKIYWEGVKARGYVNALQTEQWKTHQVSNIEH